MFRGQVFVWLDSIFWAKGLYDRNGHQQLMDLGLNIILSLQCCILCEYGLSSFNFNSCFCETEIIIQIFQSSDWKSLMSSIWYQVCVECQPLLELLFTQQGQIFLFYYYYASFYLSHLHRTLSISVYFLKIYVPNSTKWHVLR